MFGGGFSCGDMDCIVEDTDTGVRVNPDLSPEVQKRKTNFLKNLEEIKKMGKENSEKNH